MIRNARLKLGEKAVAIDRVTQAGGGIPTHSPFAREGLVQLLRLAALSQRNSVLAAPLTLSGVSKVTAN
jgi:hypothetical protein